MKTKILLTISAILLSFSMSNAQNNDESIEVATDFINKVPINLFVSPDVDWQGSDWNEEEWEEDEDWDEDWDEDEEKEYGYLSFDLKLPNGVSLDAVYAQGVTDQSELDNGGIEHFGNRYGSFEYIKENNVYRVTIQHCTTWGYGYYSKRNALQKDSFFQNRIKKHNCDGQVFLFLKVSNNFTTGLVEISNIEEITYHYSSAEYSTQDGFSLYLEKTKKTIELYVAKENNSRYDYYRSSFWSYVDGSDEDFLDDDYSEDYFESTKEINSITFYYDEKKDFRIDEGYFSSSYSYYMMPGDTYSHEEREETTYSTKVLSFTDDDPVWLIDDNTTNKISFDQSFLKYKPKDLTGWFQFDSNNVDSITNLKYLDTSEATSMSNLFKGCSNLCCLDLSTFNTSKVTSSSGMFEGCTNLMKLYISPTMGNLAQDACSGIGTKEHPCTIVAPEGFNFGVDTSGDYFIWKGGYFTTDQVRSYAVLSDNEYIYGYVTQKTDYTLTFYHDDKFGQREGKTFNLNSGDIIPGWNADNNKPYSQNITRVEFDESFKYAQPISTHKWFYGMQNLRDIYNIGYLNNSNVEDMDMMFCGCSSLDNLDLSNFTISAKANTNKMLQNCSSLKWLVVSPSMMNIASDACEGVGDADTPCELRLPEGADFGVDTYGRVFLWKSGYFYVVSATIVLSTVSLQPGFTVQLPINLNNRTDMTYNGFQFDLQLPEGVTIAKNGNKWLYTLGDRYSDEGMMVSFNDLGNGKYRLICLSMSNVFITGTSGTLLSLTLKAAEDIEIDYYSGTISNFTLSTDENISVKVADSNFLIKVIPFDPGDVNHDTVVNITDVMSTIQFILGMNPSNYDENIADMNADGNIDVTDAMAMVKVILDTNYQGVPAYAITSFETLTLAPNAYGFDINTAGEFTACQMTVTLPEGGTISNVSTTAGGKAFVKRIADNRYNVVVYSQEGMPLTKDGAFIQLRIRGNTDGISISNIQLTDRSLNTFILDETTHVIEIASHVESGDYYNVQGVKVKSPRRGVFIRDGKKMVVK